MNLDPAVTGYLETLTARARALLGSNTVGVYAAGSLALDAYEHGRSDIDIAIVCAAALQGPGRSVKRALVDGLRHESLPCPARGLELVVYCADVAGAGEPDPGFEVELNTGPRMPFRVTWAGPDRQPADGTFWYAIDRSILAERGWALCGPPAGQVFRSVTEGDLLALLTTSLRWHLGPAAGQELDPVDDEGEGAAWTDDAVLNACRAWQRVRTGHWLSKVDAGRAVVAGADRPGAAQPGIDPAVVGRALSARVGGRRPSVRDARIFQRGVLAALQRSAG